MAGSRNEKVTYLVELMITLVVTLERRTVDDKRRAAEQARMMDWIAELEG